MKISHPPRGRRRSEGRIWGQGVLFSTAGREMKSEAKPGQVEGQGPDPGEKDAALQGLATSPGLNGTASQRHARVALPAQAGLGTSLIRCRVDTASTLLHSA